VPAAIGEDEHVTCLCDIERGVDRQIVAGKVPGRDRRPADVEALLDRPHVWLHQAHAPGHDAHPLMQVGDREFRGARDQAGIRAGNLVVDD
jgi:hypothetical protein